MPSYKIYEEIKEIKKNYESGEGLEKIDGLKRSQYKVIKMCEFYSDSKYMGTYIGNKKTIGNGSIDIPFYNVVNFRVSLAKTATDLDVSDMQIVADKEEFQVQSMLLNHECYEWMKEAEFSKTLNQMGTTRPKYGGYLIKKIYDAEDKMTIGIVKWTNVVTDENDILGGPILETHHMSPVALRKKAESWNKEEVIDALKMYKGMSDKSGVIDVIEVTGEFPKELYNEANSKDSSEDDEYDYSLQRYFIANLGGKDFMLYSEELEGSLTDYYEYLSWEDNGYGLGRGVIEDSEESQVWTNDAVINEFIAMTLAGRVGIKTTSRKVSGNVLEHDHGKIYEMEDGKDMNSFNLAPSALGHYQTQIDKWNEQANNVASSYNAMTGEQPTSGTPYSQTVLLNQVASKPFDYKREEWGIHLTKVFTKWVIPYLITKLKKEHILVSDFSDDELEMIDRSFANKTANELLKEELLKGNVVSPMDQEVRKLAYLDHIKKNGKKRYIEIPEGYFDDIECKVTVLTTGEQKNKAVILSSLSNIMETVIKSFNPNTGTFGVLEDPTLSKIFKTIVELSGTGISPVSIGKGNKSFAPIPMTSSQTPQSTPAMPTGAGAPQASPALTA
jgi:hypothetical protein